jgi:tryptophan-rich sensory protein
MASPSLKRDALGLAGWIAATFAAGGLGAIASTSAATVYGLLSKPSWAPPAWLFGPAWSTLYLLMSVAAWLVWRRSGFAAAALALGLFATQLVANALWTWLFFRWQLGPAALVEIVVLWLLIGATTAAFWPLHRAAALLLLPYLAWVGYATALTAALLRLNPSALG